MVIFHSYVNLLEGIPSLICQRVPSGQVFFQPNKKKTCKKHYDPWIIGRMVIIFFGAAVLQCISMAPEHPYYNRNR